MRRRRPTPLRAIGLAAGIVTACLLGGCAGGGGVSSGPPPQRGGRAVTFVALAESLEASEVDPRLSWPELLTRQALPYWTKGYEVGLTEGWEDLEDTFLGQLRVLRPTVVVVEAGELEALDGMPVSEFANAVRGLLAAIAEDGVRLILVADVVPLRLGIPGQLPSGAVYAAYDSALAAAARSSGAVLVHVAAGIESAARAHHETSVGAGFTPLGESLVANALAKALKQHPLWPS